MLTKVQKEAIHQALETSEGRKFALEKIIETEDVFSSALSQLQIRHHALVTLLIKKGLITSQEVSETCDVVKGGILLNQILSEID